MQRFVSAVLVALAVGFGLASATRAEERSWRCLMPPVEPCVERHGRLSSQNGVALTLWLIGTKRVLNIQNDFETDMPSVISKYLEITSPDHSDIYGDFEVCPLEAERPGWMRAACIVGARRLVVQDRGSARSPFKLLSTWPSTEKN